MIKKGSTLVLKATVCVMALVAIALGVFALPEIWRGGSAEFPSASKALFLVVCGLYAAGAPFFIVLWQTMKLLGYIDANKAFSDLSVKALNNIKRCALVMGALCIGGVPLLYPIADADDAPGILVFGFVLACMPVVIGIFAAVLERLLQNAIDMKSENELTV